MSMTQKEMRKNDIACGIGVRGLKKVAKPLATTTLTIKVDYDESMTDPEGIACAADKLLETILSTPGIMDEYGNPHFGEFLVAKGK